MKAHFPAVALPWQNFYGKGDEGLIHFASGPNPLGRWQVATLYLEWYINII